MSVYDHPASQQWSTLRFNSYRPASEQLSSLHLNSQTILRLNSDHPACEQWATVEMQSKGGFKGQIAQKGFGFSGLFCRCEEEHTLAGRCAAAPRSRVLLAVCLFKDEDKTKTVEANGSRRRI